ncbi:FkbM family methyltransferase [Segetibacter aerophilus]|uniref:FkbM family methyltransferase n=1 Tax=Segetibacter aerophilus TaxID=670293 RepID=UPI001478393B|nr:FkbM family methyltransferase [Segetibacter aerophilus]
MKSIKILFHQFPFFFALRLAIYKLVSKILGVNLRESFSQFGEDVIIQFFIRKSKGFFVDIGCNHPINFSNTFELYKRGWTGINVDANPDLIKKFTLRPKDISVCEAVSNEVKEMTFYEFEETEVSTLDNRLLKEWKERWRYKNARKVITKTLTQILDENSIPQDIDFLTIDVEGHDFEVLISLDFERYHPELILIEIHDFNIKNYETNKLLQFLDSKGYDLIGYVTLNGYFRRRPKSKVA